MKKPKNAPGSLAEKTLDDSTNYRCAVNAKGKISNVTLTGLCIRLTNNKVYSYSSDRPLICVIGPVGKPDFKRDDSVPF